MVSWTNGENSITHRRRMSSLLLRKPMLADVGLRRGMMLRMARIAKTSSTVQGGGMRIWKMGLCLTTQQWN